MYDSTVFSTKSSHLEESVQFVVEQGADTNAVYKKGDRYILDLTACMRFCMYTHGNQSQYLLSSYNEV